MLAANLAPVALAATGVVFGPNTELSADSFSTAVDQTEPTIAVNPSNPLSLVVGFHDRFPTPSTRVCRFGFTIDGGRTWTLGGGVTQSGNSCSDPGLAADLKGNFYFSYIDQNFTPPFGFLESINVAKSIDGGRTFPTFSIVATSVGTSTFLDKPYIAVDAQPKSRFRGNVYVSYTEFRNDLVNFTTHLQIKAAVSQDGGLTWSNPVPVSPAVLLDEEVQDSLPVVAPDGTVYVFYIQFTSGKEPMSVRFSKSTNGGRTWSDPADVASNLPSPGFFTLKNADPQFGVMPFHGFFVTSYPTAAIAPSGTVYVAWTDFPHGTCIIDGSDLPPCTNSDVRLAFSTDGGKTWTAPVQVSDEINPSDQFFPWIATHPSGLLSILWLDKRLDPNNENYDAFYTNTGGGKTFLPNVRISSQTSMIGQATSIGDYNNLAVTRDRVYPVWNDLRSVNDVNIFTATGTLVS